jgi:glycerophosphoryl diester phosphodiesterase
VIAHRGASASAPENTVAAFRLAVAMGADMVELDVRRTADRALAVHHDAHLPAGPAVVNVLAADLPPHVPLLEEALDACAGVDVNIEIKNTPGEPDRDGTQFVAGEVVGAVRRGGRHGRVLVSSFDLAAVDRVRALDPGIATAWLVVRADAATVATTVAHGHGALHPHHAAVDAALVEAAHRAGLDVNVWTVDDPARMAQLVALGVDAICTNRPEVLLRLLGRDGQG